MNALITEQEWEDYKSLRKSTNDRVARVIENIIGLINEHAKLPKNRLGSKAAVALLIQQLSRMRKHITYSTYGSLVLPEKIAKGSTMDILDYLDRKLSDQSEELVKAIFK